MLLILFTAVLSAQPVMAQLESRHPDRDVPTRVGFILMRSTQIAETKKRPDRNLPPSMRSLESVWLDEIRALESYCLKKFGKSVSLAPVIDAASAAKVADGEADVPLDQVSPDIIKAIGEPTTQPDGFIHAFFHDTPSGDDLAACVIKRSVMSIISE